MNPTTVVIADDQDLIRAGLQAILSTAPGIEVVGVAHDGGMAAALARRHRADVVLMDIQMPGVDGLEGLARVAKDGLATKVLMLTMFDLDEYVYAALRAGASGFLLKTTPPDALIRAILACHAGEVLFAPTVTRRLVESFVARAPAVEGIPTVLRTLTPRELDVFAALASGSKLWCWPMNAGCARSELWEILEHFSEFPQGAWLASAHFLLLCSKVVPPLFQRCLTNREHFVGIACTHDTGF